LPSRDPGEQPRDTETAAPGSRNIDIPARVSRGSACTEPRLSNETHAKGFSYLTQTLR
jgi:hypothetical protein